MIFVADSRVAIDAHRRRTTPAKLQQPCRTTSLVSIPHEGSYFLRNTTASPYSKILLTCANFTQAVEARLLPSPTIPHKEFYVLIG